MKLILSHVRFFVGFYCLTNSIAVQPGYYFENNFSKPCTITIDDQDHEPIVKNFELQPKQALIFACNYLKRQNITKIRIYKHDSSDNNKTRLAKLCVSCPNVYYNFYNLKGKFLGHETPSKATASFKNDLQQCLFIKRGFIQHGLFVRNIEHPDKDLLITLKKEKNKTLLEKFSLTSNGELYFSGKEQAMLKNLKLQMAGELRSNKTKKRITLYEEQLPTAPIKSFDSQIVYSLAVGLSFAYRHGINQFDEPTKESLQHLNPYKEYLNKTTLLTKKRIEKPLRLHQCLHKKTKKYAHCILKNTEKETYEITIFDQNNEPLITSFILAPQQTLHLATSYLQNQSVQSLHLIAQSATHEKQVPHRSTIRLTPRSKEVMSEKYSILGDHIRTLNNKKFYNKVRINYKTCRILRGFTNHGYFIRNISTHELNISIKDDHNKPILDHYAIKPNGEIYFSPHYCKRAHIDYIFVTIHQPSTSTQEKNLNEGSIIIKTPNQNFDNQMVYNVTPQLQKITSNQMFLTKHVINQFNEISKKPITLHAKFSDFLARETLFYKERDDTPLIMKKGPMADISEKISGPISPSTKI